VCDRILEQLQGNQRVAILSMDSYYRGLSAEESAKADDYNFDHPDAFDWELIAKHLAQLKRKKPIEVPHYDFKTHARTGQTTSVYGADVILFEGILVFAEAEVRDLMDMKGKRDGKRERKRERHTPWFRCSVYSHAFLSLVFVDTDDDTRLIRRIRRDIKDRGRNLEGTLVQYERFVKPSFEMYIAPTKKYADVIIPRGQSNTVAIGLIVQHIKQELEHRTPTSVSNRTPGKKR
jgi:uridine kinase